KSGERSCSAVLREYPDCQEGGNEASLLVSPLVVAGIVIGLVLFLSCVTIIVGSLRKDSRLRNPHLHASYGQWSNFMDGLSYGGSIGELRSTCVEDFPPAFDFDSYVETLSQVNVMYPDSPPHYDECVGQGTQIYVPTDDPPPYSLTDPCRDGSSHYPTRLQDFRHQPIASISLSALPLDEAPPYEAVVSEQNHPLPLMPLDLLKHTTADSSPQDSVSHRIL
uniref:Brain expressed, associated with NEDD4, 1 n=1 Tax=Sinocyclocheilus anshuiensis TaxID=1608454 RepID=A0A671LP18_9TELE